MVSSVHHSNYKYCNTANNEHHIKSIININSEQGRTICIMSYGVINLDFHVFVIINLRMKAGYQTIDFYVFSSTYTLFTDV